MKINILPSSAVDETKYYYHVRIEPVFRGSVPAWEQNLFACFYGGKAELCVHNITVDSAEFEAGMAQFIEKFKPIKRNIVITFSAVYTNETWTVWHILDAFADKEDVTLCFERDQDEQTITETVQKWIDYQI